MRHAHKYKYRHSYHVSTLTDPSTIPQTTRATARQLLRDSVVPRRDPTGCHQQRGASASPSAKITNYLLVSSDCEPDADGQSIFGSGGDSRGRKHASIHEKCE